MPNTTCSVAECGKEATAPRGWCWKHYNHWRRQGDPLARFVQQPCSVDACSSPSRVASMCDMHYRRVVATGDPHKGRVIYPSTCTAADCSLSSHQRGLCRKHYYISWTTEGNGLALKAAASAIRRARVAASPVIERGLSWRKLWAEGERTCYLCGRDCNPEDFRTIVNKANREQKIPGSSHPSLDHITALANGGGHTRTNAAIACMSCNSRKHSKVDYEAGRNQGQAL